jgi:hypothetical protein
MKKKEKKEERKKERKKEANKQTKNMKEINKFHDQYLDMKNIVN